MNVAMLSLHSSPIGPLGTQDTGGMSIYVRELARGLGAAGHRVDIFTCAGESGTAVELSANVRLVHLETGLKRMPPKEALPERFPDIFEALEGYRQNHPTTYDIVHSHYWLSGVVGLDARKAWKCPHVVTFHTLAGRKNRDSAQENEPDLRLAYERRLAAEADRIVVPVQAERRFLEAHYGANQSRIEVIPAGVDAERFTPVDRKAARGRLNLPEEIIVILYVGRFAPLKRVDRLIESVAQLRSRGSDAHLVVVGGDDPEAPSTKLLKAVVAQHDVEESVHFGGRIDHNALPLYYSAANLLALPSDYESFGLVLLEAMACGTPVAATGVGIAPALIEEGINGTLLEDNAVDSLVRGVERLTKGGPLSARRIRSSVRAYDWRSIAASMADVYGSLLKRETP